MDDREKEYIVQKMQEALEQAENDGCFYAEIRRPIVFNAIALLKEQEAKQPVHVHEEFKEHDWYRDEDGNIDEFAMEYGYHNGPACKRCGYSFCEHCKPNGWNEEPCIIDYYQCPKCRKHIPKYGKNIEYCVHCGQKVKWE